MKTPEESGQNEGSQVDPLMPVVPQIGPGISESSEQPDSSFDLKRPGHGRRVNDKEEKIGEHRLAFGVDMAVEKHQERGKRMDDEESRPQDQAVFHAAIHD